MLARMFIGAKDAPVAKLADEGFDPKAFLAKVGTGKTILKLEKNQHVFEQGDVADKVFYIQKGRVKLTVLSEQGKEAVGILILSLNDLSVTLVDGTAVVGEAEVVTSADLYSLVRLARPQAVIDGGRRQLPTGTRLTANQVALRARCCSRCSTASLAFDSLLSRRQLDGLSLSQLRRPPRWWISVLERDPNFHGQRGQRDVITHDLISKSTNSQSIKKREWLRYRRLSRYRPRCGRWRGGRVSHSANAKPIPPAINIEPSGLSCTFFTIACEPSRKVSPLFS